MQTPTSDTSTAGSAGHGLPNAPTPSNVRSLLNHARDPADVLTLAFAGIIGRALEAGQRPLIRGLAETGFQRLLDAYFSGLALANDDRSDLGKDGSSVPADELEDLRELLMEARRESSEALAWLSQAVASAAMCDNHLWQDMGLPDRRFLSGLMSEYFPALAARNVGDMKWKKFFYRQLCERANVPICKSPNCAVCVDYRICFGHEEEASPTSDAGIKESNAIRDRPTPAGSARTASEEASQDYL